MPGGLFRGKFEKKNVNKNSINWKNIFLQVAANKTGLNHNGLKDYLFKYLKFNSSIQEKDRGYLLLDYHWQSKMGDLEFDSNDFPDVEETIRMVK